MVVVDSEEPGSALDGAQAPAMGALDPCRTVVHRQVLEDWTLLYYDQRLENLQETVLHLDRFANRELTDACPCGSTVGLATYR
jgi:hypothetical protein